MPLLELELFATEAELPEEVADFLRDADQRIRQFSTHNLPATGFVPSDYVLVYHMLRALSETDFASGNSFCEWGSGFGVVTMLAAMLGYEACGMEILGELVDASRSLADDYDLDVEFAIGSFLPPGSESEVEEAYAENTSGPFLVATDVGPGYDELGLGPEDFDIIFAYPWPGEHELIANLFEKFAAQGALLLTYDCDNSVTLRRNAGTESR